MLSDSSAIRFCRLTPDILLQLDIICMQRLPDRHPTYCMSVVSTSHQWVYTSVMSVVEGETGRQQSMFSTTNDLSLESTTTSTALAQTSLPGKQDRQACYCLLPGTDQTVLLNWFYHLRGISCSCMLLRVVPAPLYQHCHISSIPSSVRLIMHLQVACHLAFVMKRFRTPCPLLSIALLLDQKLLAPP